ncbi:proline-rich acidic protein 1 [Limosa lapponica baueri]|uniref:Proline-rich acidic protein 1 n=1 Tax=Limosa lapponica baueri TaxID=1758121 RepID=A0A2I0U9J2_LIMLA|nr:proline-rich acidic protein 1 [Limosa lapponica baueri]
MPREAAAPDSGQSSGQRLGQPTDGSHGAAPSDTGRKDLDTEEDLAREILLGIKAVEPPEEGEITGEVEPGLKVFPSSAWARGGPVQAQVGPEEDRDQLYHPQDNAREADARRPPQMLSLEVQTSPEEDRDHLYHG